MRVLFLMRHAGFARNFESTLRLLAERDHEVHVAFDGPFAGAGARPGVVERLASEHASITFGPAPDRTLDPWFALGLRLRLGLDLLRYLTPPFADAPKLRSRVEARAGALVRALARVAARRPGGPAVLSRALRALDAAVPVGSRTTEFVRATAPDVLLVTPLVELGEPQTDFLRAARDLAIPTGLCVASWDNLTNKGRVSELPDLVTVWNEAQRREAIELHGVPPERVVATGAQTYDHWFDWSPSRDRSAFAAHVGLPAEVPFLLYLCSSVFIAPEEADFVRRWLSGLRRRPETALRSAGVLVRPHPQHAAQWCDADLRDLGPVAVWPPEGADPVDPDSRRDYFDSIHHCAAVVGVNTSALIESAIVGRPVFTYLAPEFRETQGGIPHFAHLSEGGPLTLAATYEDHAAQLAAALGADGDLDRGRAVREGRSTEDGARAFVRSFVRPHGLETPATPRLVEAIEGLSRTRRPASRRSPRVLVLRALMTPFAGLAGADAALRAAVRAVLARTLSLPLVGALVHRALPGPLAADLARRSRLPGR